MAFKLPKEQALKDEFEISDSGDDDDDVKKLEMAKKSSPP